MLEVYFDNKYGRQQYQHLDLVVSSYSEVLKMSEPHCWNF